MLQRRHQPDLALEALERQLFAQLRTQYFHDDVAVELFVACDVHARHPAAAKLTMDREA
jgi:hypothetical protein